VKNFCGELKKQLAENSLNNYFLLLADIFTSSPSSFSSESYTKKKKKEKLHEDVGKRRKWLFDLVIKMLFNWSARVNC
jgi:hypothetical protein